MIGTTGIWDQETADTGHVFSYKLAKWISEYLPKEVQVNDFGCGKGTYLTYLFDRGFRKFMGFEGAQLNNFELEERVIKIQDLSERFDVPVKGNTICLEVIEHVPFELSATLFDNICNNTQGKIITSCAIPGQGGDGHVNCRSNLWAIKEMKNRGFALNIEDSIAARSVIENHCAWFRETIMIFE